MNWIDLISMIVGILSLFATIAISFVIYYLENKTKKREKQQELKQQARDFIAENIDEKEYLPLAQFATKLAPFYKHNRKIYNRFSRCDLELQKEILRQANFKDLQLEKYNDNFCDKLLNMYEQDAKRMKLFTETFLYEGAKYFYRGLKPHGNVKLCGDLEQDKTNNEPRLNYLTNDLYHYSNNNYTAIAENEIWLRLLDYSLIQNNEMSEERYKDIKRFSFLDSSKENNKSKYLYVLPNTFKEFKKMHKIPPLDYYWYLVTSVNENVCVYIVMEMIRQSCLLINRENNNEWLTPFEGDYEIERNEDLFYATVQTLFCTYSRELINSKHKYTLN